jgi:hypothetical protein
MTLQDDPDHHPDPKVDGPDRSPLGWVLAVIVFLVVAVGATWILGRGGTTTVPTQGAAGSTAASAPAR